MKPAFKKAFVFILAVVVFFFVLVMLEESELEQSSLKQNIRPSLPSVSYVEVGLTERALEIPVHGELKPKWDVWVRSFVNGEVVNIADKLVPGQKVEAGDTLAEIDPSSYAAQVKKAELAIEQAKLDLLQAQKRSDLAFLDWQRSGLDTPATDLMLFKPQIEIAKRSLLSAEADLVLAKKFLSYTHISAPFSGLIIENAIGKGQAINEGDNLFRLIDDKHLNLDVALGEHDWLKLANEWEGQVVDLFSTQDKLVGHARLARGGHFLDQDSRQYILHLEISPALRRQARAGQFVKLNLPGREVDKILNLPESALTQDGSVWLIDENNLLREYKPNFYERLSGNVLVPFPSDYSVGPEVWRVAILPLDHFMSGKEVHLQVSASDVTKNLVATQER